MFALLLAAAIATKACADPSIVSANLASVTANGTLKHYTIAIAVSNLGGMRESGCSRFGRSNRSGSRTHSIARPMPETARQASRSSSISTGGQAATSLATAVPSRRRS
jgi:hypothetical protein